MGKYDSLKHGRDVAVAAKNDLLVARGTLGALAGSDWLPVEHRLRLRDEAISAAQQALTDGRTRLREWARQVEAEAIRDMNRDDVDDAASESRRVAMETLTSRLVNVALARGNAREAAENLTAESQRLLGLGRGDEADAYARAALDLDPDRGQDAQVVRDLVFFDRVEADSVKRRARAQLADAQVTLAAGERDLAASYAGALKAASDASRTLGDADAATAWAKRAASESIEAKVNEYVRSRVTGQSYVEPEGTLPGGPNLEG